MPAIAMAVFDLIDRLAASTTVTGVWDAYLAAARSAGFDHGLAFFSNHDDTALARRSFSNSTPAGWLEAYTAAHCEQVDPIALRLKNSATGFRFQLTDFPPLPSQRTWYDLAQDAGLKSGWIMPDHSSTVTKVVALMGEHADVHPHDRMALQLAGLEMLHRVEALGVHPPAPDTELHLSDRERECLQWIAGGKTDWEIGRILAISEKTVNIYVQRAKQKLHTQTRSQTVMAALRQGLMNP